MVIYFKLNVKFYIYKKIITHNIPYLLKGVTLPESGSGPGLGLGPGPGPDPALLHLHARLRHSVFSENCSVHHKI